MEKEIAKSNFSGLLLIGDHLASKLPISKGDHLLVLFDVSQLQSKNYQKMIIYLR